MSLIASFGGVQVLYQKNVAPETSGNFIVHFSWYDQYGKSNPTSKGNPLGLGRKNDELRWIYGLPDPQRIHEENESTEPTSIELNENKQHYLLYINLCSYTGRYWTKDEYYSWWNSSESPSKSYMVSQLNNALKDDRSHTNGHGMNNGHNWLTGENTNLGNPLFAKLITGRARLRLLDDTPQFKNLSGQGLCIAFQCINASEDLWKYNPIHHPWLFDMPCITGRVVVKDKAGLHIERDDLHYPYGLYSDKLVFPIWLPRVSIGYVPYKWTRPLGVGEPLQKQWIRG